MNFIRIAFLVFFNLIFLYIFGSVMIDISPLIWNFEEKNLTLICSAFDTVSIILLTYGVVLEKSSSLLEIFKIYPKYKSPLNTKFDQTSSHLGLLLILCGLFAGVPVQFVKASNKIINTSGIDRDLFCVALIFLFLICLLIINYSYKFIMIFNKTKNRRR